MNAVKMIIRFGLVGICIGSAAWLVSLVAYQQSLITQSEIISLFIASGLVGELSMIFKLKKFKFMLKLAIHYVGTNLIMIVFGVYNHYIDDGASLWSFVVSVTFLYVIISLGQYLMNIRYANNINQLIKNRKKDHH